MDENKAALTEYEKGYLRAILSEKEARLRCELFTGSEKNQCHIYSGINLIDRILSKLE
jgi:hypothetical protein